MEDVGVGVGGVILISVLAALPSLFVALWAWFKARAAMTPEKWDDTVVSVIESIAKKVVASQ